MSLCLAIETSGSHLGLGLYEFGESVINLAEYFSPGRLRQSDELFPQLTKLMKKADVSKRNLNLIAVDVGPGSFTGVRVGVAAARAMAQGLSIPLIGVCSLEAMAWRAATDNEEQKFFVPYLPALSGEVYGAVYQRKNGELTVLVKPCWKKTEAFFGNRKGPYVSSTPYPNAIAWLAIHQFLSGKKRKNFGYEKVVPLYLQPSWAERQKVKK